MPLTIAVASLKGGVGKTTVSLNLACALHHAGHKTLLVDLDPQGTATSWAAVGAEQQHPGPAVVALGGAALRRDLPAVAAAFEVVVLDCPPRLGREASAAMLVADLVILPATPGAADLWALRQTVALLEEARALRPELRAVALLNRADRTTLTRLTKEALADLQVPLLPVALSARVTFGEATLAGLGVVTYAPSSPAAREVTAVTDAVLLALAPPAQEVPDAQRQTGRRVQAQAASPPKANPRARGAGDAVRAGKGRPATARAAPARGTAAGQPPARTPKRGPKGKPSPKPK